MAEYAVVLVVAFLLVLCGSAALMARPPRATRRSAQPATQRSVSTPPGPADRSFLPAGSGATVC